MILHTYRIHLDSPFVRLPDVDDLLGKDVEVTIRELHPAESSGNANKIEQFLARSASATFFGTIEDPSDWQKRIRDEWE